MEIDPRIKRIVRIEIQIAIGDFEPAEWQSCFDIFQPNESLQTRMQSGAGQLQVSDRAAGGEISANEEWIFRLDRDIKFPVANWRIGKRKLRTRLGRLRRGPSRQSDRNQIDVLEKLTIR